DPGLAAAGPREDQQRSFEMGDRFALCRGQICEKIVVWTCRHEANSFGISWCVLAAPPAVRTFGFYSARRSLLRSGCLPVLVAPDPGSFNRDPAGSAGAGSTAAG